MGDHYLRRFLLATATPSGDMASRIRNINWLEASVQREWHGIVSGAPGYLDILVVNRQARFLCAVENKVFAPESEGQLAHYRQALENEYPDFTRHFVFLSPDGRSPQEVTERVTWTPASYATVRCLVEKTLDDDAVAISEDVRVFLRQYATTLRRNVVPESTEMQRLARKLYLEYREAIDLIYRHRPKWVKEAKQILKEAVAQQEGWKLDQEHPDFVRFRSDAWDDFPATRTGTGWKPSQALLLFQFNFRDGDGNRPYLDLGLSPGTDETVREDLFEAARQNPALFRALFRLTTRSLSFQSGWMILHEEAEYILDDSDYSIRWDDGAVRDKIMAWVDDFARNKFPAMNEVILNCLREYGAGQTPTQS